MAINRRKMFPTGRDSDNRRIRPRFLIMLGFVLALGYFGYHRYLGYVLGQANEALISGDYQKAEKFFKRAAGFPLSKGRGHDGLGALALMNGDQQAAKEHFKVILEKKPKRIGGNPAAVLEAFLNSGDYPSGEHYREFLENWRKPKELKSHALALATLSLGNHQVADARKYLEGVPEEKRNDPDYQRLSAVLNQIEKDNAIPVMNDRHGQPLLVYDIENKSYRYLRPQLFSGWGLPQAKGNALDTFSDIDFLNQTQTTLDLGLQKAASQAMRGYDGTMVLLEPKSGAILAAYGTEGLNPFITTFEPGSVIKLLTYAVFLQEERDTKPYAPKIYPAYREIDGKVFYDWTSHGRLASIDQGMAVSCNLMFAQMGIDLGWPRLGKTFQTLFTNPADYQGLPINSQLGQVSNEPENAYELGRIAIGLDHLETTVLGLSLIPMAVANQGQFRLPYLVSRKQTLNSTVLFESSPAAPDRLFPAAATEAMLSSMVTAVDSPRGTARRAKSEFVQAAMKTGTAGERPFDSVMVGLFPVEDPKVAFAFFLHRGGKCEINGAKVAKNLQLQVKALAPDYLEQ